MTTFDDVLPTVREVLSDHREALGVARPIVVNRDLNGRVRLLIDEQWREHEQVRTALDAVARELEARLGRHAFPAADALLFEPDLRDLVASGSTFPVDEEGAFLLVDRLTTDADWSSIAEPTTGPPRIVFYSIKGGVGRSTALAVAAWHLAERGQRVLVADLDLESPGLSTALLPEDRRPRFGATDWLVENLVGNAATVLPSMVATSTMSREGTIDVVPAHGAEPGEYIAKLGRVWMSTMGESGLREAWTRGLQRMLTELEAERRPTVVLIDARAGIDEMASACLTDLGATSVLAFAVDSQQTWSGYRILLEHWNRTRVIRQIRERLQIVGALTPEKGTIDSIARLREHAWDVFTAAVYDEVPPPSRRETTHDTGPELQTPWSFDLADATAPHAPWVVRWNSGFASLESLHGRLIEIDTSQARAVFGPLLEGIDTIVDAANDVP